MDNNENMVNENINNNLENSVPNNDIVDNVIDSEIPSGPVVSKTPEVPVKEEETLETVSETPVIEEPILETSEAPVMEELPTFEEPIVPVTEENVVPEVPVNNVDNKPLETNNNKKNSKKSIVIIVLISLLFLIGAAVIFLLPKFLINDKQIVQKEISTIFNEVKEVIKEENNSIMDIDFDKDTIGIEGSLTIDSDYSDDRYDLSKLKQYKLNYQGLVDKNNSQVFAKVDLLKNSSSYLNMSGLIDNDTAYVYLENIYNKVLKTKLGFNYFNYFPSNSITIDDINYILDKTEEIINNNVDETKITNTKENKEINGKNSLYTKISYEINENELESKIFKAYSEDDKILEMLSRISKSDKSKVKEMLIGMSDKNNQNSNTIYMDIYLNSTKDMVETVFTYDDDSFVIDSVNKGYNYSLNERGETIISGTYNRKEGKYTLKYEGATVTIEKNDNITNINFYIVEGNGSEVYDIKIKNKNNVGKSKQVLNTVVDLKYKIDNTNVEAVITNDLTLEKNKQVETISKENAVDINSLSEEELDRIESTISDKIEGILGEVVKSNSYNNNYGYNSYYNNNSYTTYPTY